MKKLLSIFLLPLSLAISCSNPKGNFKEALRWVDEHHTPASTKYVKENRVLWDFSNSTGPLAFAVVRSLISYFGASISHEYEFKSRHILLYEKGENILSNLNHDEFLAYYDGDIGGTSREYKFNENKLTAITYIKQKDDKVDCYGVYHDYYDERGFVLELDCIYDYLHLGDGTYVEGHIEQYFTYYEDTDL